MGTVNASVLVLDAQVCVLVNIGAVTLKRYHEYFPLPCHYRNLHTVVQYLNVIFEQPPGIIL